MPSSQYFKTIDPYLYNVNLYYDKNYYQKFSNYYKVLIFGIDTLKTFIDYNKSKELNNTIAARIDLYNELNKTEMDKFDQLQFKIYWYEKFFNDFSIIREEFYKQSKDNIYFKQISDSIGLLRNYFTVPDDSTLLIKDTDFEIQFANGIPAPVNVGSSAFSKLRTNTIAVTIQLNLLNTILYRQNMSNVQGNFAYPTEAHGENLVTDYNHINKIKNIAKESLEKSLRTYYGKLYDLILFYENFNYGDYEKNLAKMDKGAIEIDIEGTIKKVTYLQQEAEQYINTVNLYSLLTAQAVS